jgi:hypothetical protein
MTQMTHGHHGVRGAGRRLALALGAAGLLAGSLAAPAAHAALIRCSTDPVVILSNGAQVTMSNDIYDVSTNVTKVAYILHAPIGTTVTSVSYANSTAGIPETFTFYADTQPGDYDSYVVTTDANSKVSVYAYTTVQTVSGKTQSLTAQGHPGQQIHIHVHQY